MLSPADIVRLARLYAAAEGIALSTVGRRACGNNRILPRIERGLGANTRTLAVIETFFRANWPQNAAWPPDLAPGPITSRRRSRTPTESGEPSAEDASCAESAA
jgi:hypothetical protein